MSTPPHYREDRPEHAADVIRRFPFATLISVVDGTPLVSHIPLLLKDGVLNGHFARANPHWKSFASGEVTAIFHGPHAYVSPAWYAPQPDNVPTWNYVAVHARGEGLVIDDAAESARIMRELVEHFENLYGTKWSLPENEELIQLARGIVTFRLSIRRMDAKFKLSQKETPENRANVIEQLAKFGDEGRGVAEYMKLVTSLASG